MRFIAWQCFFFFNPLMHCLYLCVHLHGMRLCVGETRIVVCLSSLLVSILSLLLTHTSPSCSHTLPHTQNTHVHTSLSSSPSPSPPPPSNSCTNVCRTNSAQLELTCTSVSSLSWRCPSSGEDTQLRGCGAQLQDQGMRTAGEGEVPFV